MAPGEKYDVDDPAFDAAHGVLRNRRSITDAVELERAENNCLISAYESAALSFSETHRFSEADVRDLHRLFLGSLYEWAGSYRIVDISSADIRWCHAAHIGKEMARLGQRLSALTPLVPTLDRPTFLSHLAELHGGLVVIHPFRDGNGRTTRILTNLLLMQAEKPPIRLASFDDAEVRKEYHAAIREVWAAVDYRRLMALFDRLIEP